MRISHGPREGSFNASSTTLEFVSNQLKFNKKPWVMSAAWINPNNLWGGEERRQTNSAKPYKISSIDFQNKPPQEAVGEAKEPSMLHLRQPIKGSFQRNSSILRALGGWMVTLKLFILTKSYPEELETFSGMLPMEVSYEWVYPWINLDSSCTKWCLILKKLKLEAQPYIESSNACHTIKGCRICWSHDQLLP